MTGAFEERADELEVLAALLERAAGGTGGVLVVEGEPGIGKTSLLAHLVRDSRSRGLTALPVRCLQLDQDTSYAAARSLCLALQAQGPAPGEAEDPTPLAAAFLAGEVPTGVDPFLVRHALTELLTQASTCRPLLVLVDDAQWADDLSLAWLVHLAGAVPEVPLALVLAVRTGAMESRPALARLATSGAVNLAPLPREHVARIVGRLIPDADPSLVDACRRQTGGNPLLLAELVREVVARNLDASEVGRVVPDGVARSVLDRLCALPPALRSVVEVAAVAGDGAAVRQVAAALDRPAEQVADSLDQLAYLGFVAEARPVQFVHPLVQLAVLTQVRHGQRSRTHRRLAAALDAEANLDRAAAHLMEVEPAADSWVVERLRHQAGVELARGAPRPAARLLRRALAEPPEPGVRAAVLTELGEAEHLAGASDAIGHLREALSTDGVDRIRVTRVLAEALVYKGAGAEAAEVLTSTRDAVRAAQPDDALALEADLLALGQIEHSTATRTGSQLDASAAGTGSGTQSAHLLAAARAYQATVVWRGTSQEAVASARWAFANGLIAEAGSAAPAVGFGLMTLVIASDPATTKPMLDAAARDAQDSGSARGIAVVATLRARLGLQSGDLQEVEVEAGTALTVATEAHPVLVPFALACLVIALEQQGMFEQAEHQLETFGHSSGAVAPTAMGASLLWARMRLRLAEGRYDDALVDLDGMRAMARGRGQWPSMWVPDVLSTLAAVGRQDEARELAEQHLVAARGWANPLQLAAALDAYACLHPSAGPELLHEALDTVPEWALLMRARILTDLGAQLRRGNHRTAARPYLSEAWRIAHECRAHPLAELARSELAATGARPRRVPLVGVAALTASERRVADLASAGHTNAEIARSLYITRKTVEKHLSSAYAKLGVANRGQLAEAILSSNH